MMSKNPHIYSEEEIANADDSNPHWLTSKDHAALISLWDRNCGNSYNPWLIFEASEIRDQCDKELKITFNDHGEDW